MAVADFNVNIKEQWCPGCGNFAIEMAVKQALDELKIPREETVIVSGVGCCSKIPHYINTYGYEALHGRVLPVASGIKLANHKLTVIGMGGDGDGYGIGMCHFIHSMRRNHNFTYIVHNNEIYGLTTGQTSPTSMKGTKSKSTPQGAIEKPVNPIALAISSGATFVARGFAGDPKHLASLVKAGIQHKGISLIDVFQPCVTFNKVNTYQWWRERVYKLEDESYKPDNKEKALEKALEDEKTGYKRIPLGIFYTEEIPSYEESVAQLKSKTFLEQSGKEVDISKAYEEMM